MKCLIVALVVVTMTSIRKVGVMAFLAAVEPNRPPPFLCLSPSDGEEVVDTHSQEGKVQSRRDLLMAAMENVAGGAVGGGVLVATLGTPPKVANAATIVEGVLGAPASASLPSGLLDSRVQGNVLAPPPYGMEGPDIFYPEYVSTRIINHSNTLSSPE